MVLLENILAVVDRSDSSKKAIDQTILLAQVFKSKVTLIHVIQTDGLSEQTKKIIHDSVSAHLSEIVYELTFKNIDVETIIREGIPYDTLIHETQISDYNVLIIGASNKEKCQSKLGVSIEKLARKILIPLWVVKNDESDTMKNILCPVDFSDASKRALSNAITLAKYFESELIILNIYIPFEAYATRIEYDLKKENEDRKSKQKGELISFLKIFDLREINYSIKVETGDPANAILRFIASHRIDLLLIGTTGKTGLKRMLMGSVTEEVIRELPCSFVTTCAKDITNNDLESNLASLESALTIAKQLYENKKYEKAIEKYRILLTQHVDNIPVLMGLIKAYKAIGNDKEAHKYKQYTHEVIERTWGVGYLNKFEF